MDDGDFDKARRNSFAISLAIILFFIGNGSIGGDESHSVISLLGSSLTINKKVFYASIWLSWVWFLWRYWLFARPYHMEFIVNFTNRMERRKDFISLALGKFEQNTGLSTNAPPRVVRKKDTRRVKFNKNMSISVSFMEHGYVSVFDKTNRNIEFPNQKIDDIEIRFSEISPILIKTLENLVLSETTFSTVLAPYLAALVAAILGIAFFLKNLIC